MLISQFELLLNQLSQEYDHIIIDTPPVLAVTDGIIISQYAGVNLLVARYAKSQMKELELSLNRFEQANVKVNGFILNDIQRSAGMVMAITMHMLTKQIKKIKFSFKFNKSQIIDLAFF
jgi:Mrp family chromosome partitioning ATPase